VPKPPLVAELAAAAAFCRLEAPSVQTTIATSIHAPSPTRSAAPRHRKPTGAPPPREAAAGRGYTPPTAALASLLHPGVHVGEIPSTSSSFSPPHSGPSQCRLPAPPGDGAPLFAAREVQRRKKGRCHLAFRTLFFSVALCFLLSLVKLAHNPL
jgi:hypothetical protein